MIRVFLRIRNIQKAATGLALHVGVGLSFDHPDLIGGAYFSVVTVPLVPPGEAAPDVALLETTGLVGPLKILVTKVQYQGIDGQSYEDAAGVFELSWGADLEADPQRLVWVAPHFMRKPRSL